ncbi:MAG: DUF3313 domain-containing protein [Nitrospirae bacterium]|nr:DUF3313 domain-containing protein [Nitrospirota bacterium]
MTKNLKQCLVMLPVLFLLLAGSVFAKEAAAPKYSGYLSDYSKLKADPDKSGVKKYRNSNIDMKKYRKIQLERIVVVLQKDAEYMAFDPAEMMALTDYFREAIKRELGNEYLLVNEPGSDVLRVRIAITDLVPTKPAMSVATLAIPFATVPDLASGAVSEGGVGSAPYLGRTAIEVEGLDSMTLEQVFSYVETRYPKKYDIDTSKGVGKAVTKGYGQYFKSYKAWAFTRDAFDYWAMKFRTRLDEAHGKKKAEEKK